MNIKKILIIFSLQMILLSGCGSSLELNQPQGLLSKWDVIEKEANRSLRHVSLERIQLGINTKNSITSANWTFYDVSDQGKIVYHTTKSGKGYDISVSEPVMGTYNGGISIIQALQLIEEYSYLKLTKSQLPGTLIIQPYQSSYGNLQQILIKNGDEIQAEALAIPSPSIEVLYFPENRQGIQYIFPIINID